MYLHTIETLPSSVKVTIYLILHVIIKRNLFYITLDF